MANPPYINQTVSHFVKVPLSMKDLYPQIRQIELDKREKLIGQIARKLKGKTKPGFSTVMHKIAEKEDNFSFLDQSRQNIESFEPADLASENLAEMFG